MRQPNDYLAITVHSPLIPAQAGIQGQGRSGSEFVYGVPAFAGTSE